jgi:hypothetical protein
MTVSCKKQGFAVVTLVLALAAGNHNARADVQYQFSGFGTAGAARSNNDAQYTRSPIQYNGASQNWDFGVDSRLGLQGVARAGDFSLTGQLLTQRVANSDVRPKVEWLFANYAAKDGVDLRVGRMVLPLFLLSDTRNVGFSSVWLRAPQEVYSLYPITGLDGVQALLRYNIGASVLTVQPSYGQTQGEYSLSTLASTIGLDIKHLASLQVNWELGNWLLHVGQSKSKLQSHLGFVPGQIPTGPSSTMPLDAVFDHDPASTNERMASYGLAYDDGHALVQAEFVKRTQNPGTYANEGYYVMAGWKFASLAPYYIYGHYKPNNAVAGLRTGNSNTVGARYDLSGSTALKVQWERRDPINLFFNRVPASAMFGPPAANWELESRKINVLSAALDVVF